MTYDELVNELDSLHAEARAAQRLGVRVELATWKDAGAATVCVVLRLKHHDRTAYEVEEVGSGKTQRASSGVDVEVGERVVAIPEELLVSSTYAVQGALHRLGLHLRNGAITRR